MKLFFSEFASCWSGATVTPASEAAGDRKQTEEQIEHIRTHNRRSSRRTAKVSGAAANWKPKLNAISENSPISDGGAAGNKRRVKAKPKSPAKAAPPPNLAEDYWRYQQTMAAPVFAPTSYLF